MAKITMNLPGGLKVEREVSDKPVPTPSAPHVPAFAADTVPVENPPKTILEKAAEVVEEVVKPKARRGRKPKPAAE